MGAEREAQFAVLQYGVLACWREWPTRHDVKEFLDVLNRVANCRFGNLYREIAGTITLVRACVKQILVFLVTDEEGAPILVNPFE